jgi:hypothetical protein
LKFVRILRLLFEKYREFWTINPNEILNMADTDNSRIPQSYDALMQALGQLSEEQRFETLLCVWLETPADGVIQTVAASYHPLEVGLTLEALAKSAKFTANWDKVLVIGGRTVNGMPLGQAEADAMIAEVWERLTGGGFSNLQDAVFERNGTRINEIEFPADFIG